MKKNLYIFSGLGADERVFKNLDFSEFNTTHIPWIDPLKNETIQEYAKRLREKITTEKPILMGLSFGGMIAIEIAKQMEVEKIILISSVKSKRELPCYYAFTAKFKLYNKIPAKILKSPNFITHWFFGAKSKPDKQLLNQILKETDPIFLRWALNEVANWNNEQILDNIIHIHGTNDKVFPIKRVHCDVKVKDGGHLMLLNKADEMNNILKKHL